MKKIMFLMVSVLLLFAVAVQASPPDKDVGMTSKIEQLSGNVVTFDQAISADINICQRTDFQLTSEVLLFVGTEELVLPDGSKTYYNYKHFMPANTYNNKYRANYDYKDRATMNNIYNCLQYFT